MRSGFSTSACAAAAACAAIQSLTKQIPAQTVSITLLRKGPFSFAVSFCELAADQATCGVVKDSGDDPDVTNGIEIRTTVKRSADSAVHFFGGQGVGIVTQPGLPVAVGEPAINPGSKQLITQTLEAFCQAHCLPFGWDLTISVPEGEAIARQTMNPRLGIEGGISILGTDGIVHPYSMPAWRGSIATGLNFAQKNGYQSVALVTGKRSEDFISRDFPKTFVINVGDDLEFPLKRLSSAKFQEVILGGMIGKLAKAAQGRFNTHVDAGGVDFAFLAEIAALYNASLDAVTRIRDAVTAHQAQIILAREHVAIEPEIAQLAAMQVNRKLRNRMDVRVCIYSLDGTLLGDARIEAE